MQMPPPPTTRWAPRVTILVHLPGQDPSVLHLLQIHREPLVILTLTSKVKVKVKCSGDLQTLAYP